jgi:hypothetical protein
MSGMQANRGASDLERHLYKIEGPWLESPRNQQALAQLACSFTTAVPVHCAAELPAGFACLRPDVREHVAHASWIDFMVIPDVASDPYREAAGRLRACVMTNAGSSWGFITMRRITPVQVVAVMLPDAPLAHPLSAVQVPGLDMASLYPHVLLAGHVNPNVPEQSGHRLWTLHGNPLPAVQLPRGYVFGGCVDGILYAFNHSPAFDAQAAMAAALGLAALGWAAWQPPTPQAVALAYDTSTRATMRAIYGPVPAWIMLTVTVTILSLPYLLDWLGHLVH